MGSSPAQGLWGDSCMDAEKKHPALNEQYFVFLRAIVLFLVWGIFFLTPSSEDTSASGPLPN